MFARIKRWFLVLPSYLYAILFIVFPLFIVLKISLSKTTITLPPYDTMFSFSEDSVINIKIYIRHYLNLLTNDFYLFVMLSSFKIAVMATFIALIIGYGVAYGIWTLGQRYRLPFLIIVMMPFFTSFLMRVYAWIAILSRDGIVNHFLLWLGVITQPLHLLDSTFAVCIGTVYCYLPFMILPIMWPLKISTLLLLKPRKI